MPYTPNSTVWGSLSPLSGPSGQVTLPAGDTTGTLTDARISATSVILGIVQSNDATAKTVVITPGAGSATIRLNAACSAACVVGYVIINPATIG